jgi:hypothetical protein
MGECVRRGRARRELPRFVMTALPADPSPPERDGEDGLTGEYHALSYADLVERLFREFEDQVTLTAIADVVRECRVQLKGSPPQALPELTERLARQRLTRIAAAAAAEPGPAPDPGAGTANIGAIPRQR